MWVLVHVRERRELVQPAAGRRQDLDGGNAAHLERVGHERTMAAPRHRLGAHDGGALVPADVRSARRARSVKAGDCI